MNTDSQRLLSQNSIELGPVGSSTSSSSFAAFEATRHIFVNPRPQYGCSKLCSHAWLLLGKNWALFTRSLKPTLFLLASPLAVMALLLFFQAVADEYTSYTHPFPQTHSTPALQSTATAGYLTLGYSIIGPNATWPHQVMQEVATNNKLTWGQEVAHLYTGVSPAQIDNLLANREVEYVVNFCTGEWSIGPATLPCSSQTRDLYFYLIETNFTKRPNSVFKSLHLPVAKDAQLLRLKTDIDRAIFQLQEGAPVLDISWADYPFHSDRLVKEVSILTTHGTVFVFCAPLALFLVIFSSVVQEKLKGLRQGLTVMGVSQSGYLLSWALTGFIFGTVIALLIPLLGLLAGFPLFSRVPFWLIFLLFFLLCAALSIQALLIASCIKSSSQATSVLFAAALVSIVIERVFSSGNTMQFVFFHTEASWVRRLLYWVFSLYAPFTFAKLWHDFTHVSENYFDDNTYHWVRGRPYSYSDLVSSRSGNYTSGGGYYVPTPLFSFGLLFATSLFYCLLLCYCDRVIDGNRGAGRSLCFCLKSRKRPRRHRIASSTTESTYDPLAVSAEQHRLEVRSREDDGEPTSGLRVLSLTKLFRSACSRGASTLAVKHVSLEIDTNEIVGLLGHNGAGKTTLINMLTGLLGPTSGAAKFAGGLSLEQDMAEIQKIISVVPQFDLLWEELTPGEHVRLFAQLKGINLQLVPELVHQHLALVGLADVAGSLTRSLSGGMKRRLSLTLGGVGNPRLVILDEPTTGMDPISRREAWRFIHLLREQRAVLLTTHSMEEADALCDRIAIIKEGSLQCVGTALALKTVYGAGYHVQLVATASENTPSVVHLFKQLAPSATLLSQSGGSIFFAVPASEVEPCFRVLEADSSSPQLAAMVSDVAVAYSSLEEVFLKVTA